MRKKKKRKMVKGPEMANEIIHQERQIRVKPVSDHGLIMK